MKMRRVLEYILHIVCVPFLLLLTGILLVCLWQLPLNFPDKPLLWSFLGGTVGGILLFSCVCRFSPVYIFGHEITHWLVAKLFRRRTGKLRLGMYSGSVEIENANVWITLAPYIIPFYLLVTVGLTGLVLAFYQPPAWLMLIISGLMGLELAYHFVLTIFALSREQEDLKRCGVVFSYALILTGNVVLLTLALLLATGQWQLGARLFANNVLAVWHFLAARLF